MQEVRLTDRVAEGRFSIGKSRLVDHAWCHPRDFQHGGEAHSADRSSVRRLQQAHAIVSSGKKNDDVFFVLHAGSVPISPLGRLRHLNRGEVLIYSASDSLGSVWFNKTPFDGFPL